MNEILDISYFNPTGKEKNEVLENRGLKHSE